jgi:hypothetical protein
VTTVRPDVVLLSGSGVWLRSSPARLSVPAPTNGSRSSGSWPRPRGVSAKARRPSKSNPPPWLSASSPPPTVTIRKRVKKNPMGLVAQAARASTLLPLSKRCGARGDANFAGCPRFDRQCGRGGVRLRRAHNASEGRDAGVHRVFGPSPRRNPLACAPVCSACGLPRRCGCLISRVWVRCACASAAPARPKRQKGGG